MMQKKILLTVAMGFWCLADRQLSVAAPVPGQTAPIQTTQANLSTDPTEAQPVRDDPDGRYSRFLVAEGGFHVLIDDLSGDGRLDLAFTSHGDNSIRVFRQVENRRFVANEAQEITGFHPNDTIALPGTPKRYLINGEGIGKLRVVAAQPDGMLSLVSDNNQDHPLGSTPFVWPDWGRLSLAVMPYTGSALTLVRDFDPEKGQAKSVVKIPTSKDPRPARGADLNGDGINELVFPTFWDSKVWAIEYAGPEQTPRLRELADLKEGWPRHVVPIDINQDNKIDLLVPMSTQPTIVVLLNDGQGQFTQSQPISYPGPVGVHTLAVGQDQGGRYLLAGGIRALVLYRERRESPGSYDTIMLPLKNPPNRVELADVDGDGWLDAVVASRGESDSQLIYGSLWDTFGKLLVNQTDTAKPD